MNDKEGEKVSVKWKAPKGKCKGGRMGQQIGRWWTAAFVFIAMAGTTKGNLKNG